MNDLPLNHFAGNWHLCGVSLDESGDVFRQIVRNITLPYDGNSIIFVLNGISYCAVEDPSDGYRSSLGGLYRVRASIPLFPRPVYVKCVFDDDFVIFVNIKTNKNILTVGTDYSDNYYPSFVSDFRPSNIDL